MAKRIRNVPPLGILLDASLPTPLHRQIGAQLRQAILERRLAPGRLLPSSRLMAAELHCARGTVLLAIDQLIAEGYVVSVAGSGVSVAANLPDEMLTASLPSAPIRLPPSFDHLPDRTKALLPDPAGLWPSAPLPDPPIAFPTGEPDRQAFPFPLWAKLLEKEWRKPAWRLAGIPHPFGHPALRAAIAAYLGVARGITCDPDSIVITAGVRQGVALFARTVLEAGAAAWIEEPSYPGMREALASAQVHAVHVPIDASGFSADAAMQLAPEARMAIVAPSHQFPLGTVLTLQRRLALLAWAERSGGWVVEDDFDGEYRYAGRPLAPLRALDRAGRVAYLGSFSKLLFPALRLSFLVLPPSLTQPTAAIIARLSAPASLLGQGALARFIAEGHLAGHLRRTRLLYAARQQAVIAAAERHLARLLQIAPDPGGMHLIAWPSPEIAGTFDDVTITATAKARGLSVSPLSVCYAGPAPRQGLLLGYAATPEAEIEPAMRLLRRVVTQEGVVQS